MRTIIALTVAAGLVAACGRTDNARTYQLTGQILVVKHDTNEVLVKHDDIPGFMPAMTMPYTVKDAAIIRERAAGDLITATLEVAPEGAHLSAITKTGSAPLPEDARTTIPAAANVHLLQAGDPVPDTKLTDQDGASIALTDFKGSAVAVTFIYTRCPLAQFCPLIDRRFAEVQKLVRPIRRWPARCDWCRSVSIRSSIARRHCARMPGSSMPIRRCGASPRPMKPPSIAWPPSSAST